MKYQSALSLSVMAACLVFLGASFAAARTTAKATGSRTMQTSTMGQKEAMKMVPAQADLMNPLNSTNIHVGQKFETKLSEKVQLKNGPVLPRGTELIGKIVNDRKNQNGSPSTLTLRFTHAALKNGKTVPIKATIVGIYSGSNRFGYSQTQTSNFWTPKTLQIDQLNALNHVDLHSRIAGSNSGVLQSKKNNIHFSPGTEFALAIAKRS